MRQSLIVLFIFLLANCRQPSPSNPEGSQSKIIRAMIESVNQRNAEAYVAGFAEEVAVFVEGEKKVAGREALRENRAQHFEQHP
ncbi:MAG: hypothetical protein AAFU64_19630, partial [Bacteroidota bacterium]